MLFPWQQEHWQQATQYLFSHRLAHAILLVGPSAIGKLDFCLAFMQKLNCTQALGNVQACGQCNNCLLFIARTHPDVRFVNVDEILEDAKSNQIKINDIREINQFITLSRQIGEYKAVCIHHAHLMNTNAANALLKTLEEPPANSVIFLITDRIESLLSTIKSRCQIWKFGIPNRNQSIQWLQQHDAGVEWNTWLEIAGNRPLLAKQLHESGLGEDRTQYFQDMHDMMFTKEAVTKISAKHQNQDLERLLLWLQSWCADLVRCHYSNQPVTLENPDIRRSLHSLIGRVDLQSLFRFMDKLIEFRRISSAPLNKRLFIEDMLIRCQEILKQPV